MSDRFISWLRTVVPAAWSALVAWLVSLGVPDFVIGALGNAGELVVLPVVLGVVYPLVRWIEPQLPDWLTRILLGSIKAPIYTDTRSPGE